MDNFGPFQCDECSIILAHPVEYTQIQDKVSSSFSSSRISFFKFDLGLIYKRAWKNQELLFHWDGRPTSPCILKANYNPHAFWKYLLLITELENHRIARVRRDLWRWSTPSLLPRQGHLGHVTLECVQVGECLQRGNSMTTSIPQ